MNLVEDENETEYESSFKKAMKKFVKVLIISLGIMVLLFGGCTLVMILIGSQ